MPENTSKRDPLIHMLGLMADGQSGYIEGMERDGQRQLVNSTDLPSKGPTGEMEKLGFTFGEPHQHDPLFRPATLPDGWKREGSDHAMWSYILDEKGRRRVFIFYKAAFYDRRADMNLVHPTAPLNEMYYADDAPTAIPIDDLLTVEMAREWIDDNRKNDRDHRDNYLTPGAESSRRYTAKLARLDLMESLLPDGD